MARGDPYGSFTGAFEGTITFEWAPDPLIVAQNIRTMADDLSNMIEPLQAARQIAAQDVQKRFDTKTDPDGKAWEPWAPSYAAKPPIGTLLEATGAMRAAAASPAAFDVNEFGDGGEVVFTGAGLPEYWIYHQLGASRQQHSVETREFIKQFSGTEPIANELPARPFVGLSEEAELMIVDIFDEWFAGVVSYYVGASGSVQKRLPGGRFGPKVMI